MNIIKAVKAFDQGKRIYRAAWQHGQTLGFETQARFVDGFAAGAYISTVSGCTELYSFTVADIRADDWIATNGKPL